MDVERQTSEITVGQQRVVAGDIRSAWFRRAPLPSPAGSGREAFVAREALGFLTSFWEASSWFWVNRPSEVSMAARKPLQLLAATFWPEVIKRGSPTIPCAQEISSAGNVPSLRPSSEAVLGKTAANLLSSRASLARWTSGMMIWSAHRRRSFRSASTTCSTFV